MEVPVGVSACPSEQAPDAGTTFELEAGVKPKLPDPCAILNLAAGVQPLKLPDACAKIKLEASLEPKPEPCEEELPPQAWDVAADDWEITPVSGSHPFFTTVLSRSQVQKQSMLAIPTRFQRHLPEARVPAILLCGNRSWTTNYCGDLKVKKLDAAWRDFAVENRLRVGDACVFELLMDAETEPEARNSDKKKKVVVFRVQVLRGGLPEEVTSKGATPDEPLVIVD